MDDVERMRRAIALAAEVRTATSPNPWVGCVVVPAAPGSGGAGRPGHVAGALPEAFEGATSPPGGPHAEVTALAAAGDQARGATLYATLEPCAHHGRTPPCTDAIVEADRQLGVVGPHGAGPHEDGVGAGPQLVDVAAGRFAGDPAAGAVRRRGTTVQARRQL